MLHTIKRYIPAYVLLLSAAAASAQNVSRVYVTTSSGINVYNVGSTGKLTKISGSPFKNTTGMAVGTNGKYFLTVGTHYLHSYAMTSTGGIGGQVSQINSAVYSGGDCGPTNNGGVMDHTGKSLYVLLYDAVADTGGPVECAAYQSFSISPTTGTLNFVGSAISNGRFSYQSTLPTIAANDLYAYAVTAFDGYTPDVPMTGFRRESSGTLDTWGFSQIDPQTSSSSYYLYPLVAVADATNHLAVADYTEYQPPFGDTYPIQLASYTIDAQGNLTSTNTWANMPTPAVNVTTMNMSPSGKFLAVAGNTSRSFSVGPTAPPGLQVFHFNGASPITRYSGIITSAAIDRLAWDNSNHLFATSRASGKLYVYTVTATSITAAPGSPYTLSNPSTLAVRPLL